jgi:hypothetical protein
LVLGVADLRREVFYESYSPLLTVQGKIDGPLSIDLERAAPQTKARVSGDAFAELPPETDTVLRDRMPRLVPLWSEYKKLVAVAA